MSYEVDTGDFSITFWDKSEKVIDEVKNAFYEPFFRLEKKRELENKLKIFGECEVKCDVSRGLDIEGHYRIEVESDTPELINLLKDIGLEYEVTTYVDMDNIRMVFTGSLCDINIIEGILKEAKLY